MTAQTTVTVYCDGITDDDERCPTKFRVVTSSEFEAARDAVDHGWAHTDAGHYCPLHAHQAHR